MKVTLVNPSRTIGQGNIWKSIDRCLPPLGLTYLAGYLRDKKIDVDIIDVKAQALTEQAFIEQIHQRKPSIVGLTVPTVMVTATLKLAELIKKADSKIQVIVGGIHPTLLPEEFLSNEYIDVVVKHEGEVTIHELALQKDLSDIEGISYKKDGKIIHNSPRAPIHDLDSLPFPAYDLLDIEKYKPSLGNYKRIPAISIITSRGCPGMCTFCSTEIFGKRIRQHSSDYVFKEIQMLVKKYGIKEISFYDDTFTMNKQFVQELCSRFIDEKMNLTWSCMSRADAIDAPTLKLMKKAGCHQIGLGIESADPTILENIKKRIDLKQVDEVCKMIKKARIDLRAMFMFGNPGETPETIQKTIKYSLKLNPDLVIYNITTPLPGTEMFYWAKEKGYLNTLDWDKYDLANIVMDLPTISADEIRKYYKQAYKKFYIRPSYLIKRLFKIRTWMDVKTNFQSFRELVNF